MAEESISEEYVTVVGIPEAKAVPAEKMGEDGKGTELRKPAGEVKVGVKEDVEDIKRRIKALLSKTLMVGLNTPGSSIVEEVVKKTGVLDEKWVHYTSVQLQNNISRENFARVPRGERIVFIPHCLRNVQKCKAPVDEDGYHCLKCGNCVIAKITAGCEQRGIRWYMVGGGSQLINIVARLKPKAIIGIACFNEISLAWEKLKGSSSPIQAVMLKKSGCVNTELDLNELWEVLDA